MTKEQLFYCQDIDWQKLENVFQEMAGKKPAKALEALPMPPDLAIISFHCRRCEKCGQKFVALARKYLKH